MYKILIVEDDGVIASTVKNQLEKWGYSAQCITDFKNVETCFDKYEPHLVLLDISLPFFNGYYWCDVIRKKSKVPIVYISSASDNINIVMAINMGGDDFVAKPFDMDVLVAKIAGMLRRTYDFSAAQETLSVAGVTLNISEACLLYGEASVELTKNEFRILQVLMENHGRIVTRDTLMTKLWETDSFIDDNTLTVNVTRLRRRLEELGLDAFIKTKKGLGYIIEDRQ